MTLREWLFRFDRIRDLKDYLRPYLTLPHEFYDVLQRIRTPNVVYDVGAAVGDKTLTVLRTFPRVMVVAFEPHPASFARLVARTAKYRDRVRLMQVAVSDAIGTATFHALSYPDASSFYRISPTLLSQGKHETSTVQVQTVTLDSVCREDIDLLKIDVEGAEDQVLRGATNTLRRTANVFVEILDPPRGPDNRERAPAMLRAAGFHLQVQYDQDYWFSRNG